jgi:RNA-directed DNA polymerase
MTYAVLWSYEARGSRNLALFQEIVDLRRGGSFGFLGFEFRRVLSLKGVWRPQYRLKLKTRTALLAKLRDISRKFRSQPVGRVIELINPILRGWVNYLAIGHLSECFSFIQNWVEKKIRRHITPCAEPQGLRLETMENALAL